jgi:hypothetical protein
VKVILSESDESLDLVRSSGIVEERASEGPVATQELTRSAGARPGRLGELMRAAQLGQRHRGAPSSPDPRPWTTAEYEFTILPGPADDGR